jgi:hypothetical protein
VPSGWTGWPVCSPRIGVPDDLAELDGCVDGILSHRLLRRQDVLAGTNADRTASRPPDRERSEGGQGVECGVGSGSGLVGDGLGGVQTGEGGHGARVESLDEYLVTVAAYDDVAGKQ